MQNQQSAQQSGQEEQNENIAHFPTRVIVSIAVGHTFKGVRTCDLEKVIKHVVPNRNLRFFQIEKYAMQVLSDYVQEQLPFLKDAALKEGESEDQLVSYYEGLFGPTLAIKGGSSPFLWRQPQSDFSRQ
jgi:hypothetical protein